MSEKQKTLKEAFEEWAKERYNLDKSPHSLTYKYSGTYTAYDTYCAGWVAARVGWEKKKPLRLLECQVCGCEIMPGPDVCNDCRDKMKKEPTDPHDELNKRIARLEGDLRFLRKTKPQMFPFRCKEKDD